MAYTRYYGNQLALTASTDNQVLLDSINWQKPCTLLGIRVPTFTGFAGVDLHANFNAREVFPAVGSEPVIHSRFIPFMQNIPVGARWQLLADEGAAATPTIKSTAIVRVGEQVGKNDVFTEGYFGTGVLAEIVNRTFPRNASVRWHNGIDGDVRIAIGGFEYSGGGTLNSIVVQGATLGDTDGISLGWPMPAGNSMVVDSVTNQAYEGLIIYDLQG